VRVEKLLLAGPSCYQIVDRLHAMVIRKAFIGRDVRFLFDGIQDDYPNDYIFGKGVDRAWMFEKTSQADPASWNKALPVASID
jgi:hypothetical protein